MATSFTCQATCDGTGLALSGEIDLAVRDELLAALLGALARAGPISTVDMSRVTFLDCTGIGTFVAANNTAHHNGQAIQLIHLRQQTRRLLEITGDLSQLTTSSGHRRSAIESAVPRSA